MPIKTHNDMIFDIGVNHGEDSEFYLEKGFRVVAVEADPVIAEELVRAFEWAQSLGRWTLEPVGLMTQPGTLPFYRNLDCDHWSSFDPIYGCRNNTTFEVVDVPCLTIADLLEKHGCPYYMKIDIEGADEIILTMLQASPVRPAFISVEEFGHATIPRLAALGYDRFSLRPQLDKSWAQKLETSREGRFFERVFTQRDSGAFGLDVDEWLDLDAAVAAFYETVRSPENVWLPPPGEWYDIHATTADALAAADHVLVVEAAEAITDEGI